MFNNKMALTTKKLSTISYYNGETDEWEENETVGYYPTKEAALEDLKVENGHIETTKIRIYKEPEDYETLTLFDEKEQRLYEYHLYTKELEEDKFFTLYEDNIVIEFNGKRYYRSNSYYFISHEELFVL